MRRPEEKLGGERGGSKCTIIELSCAPGLLQARIVLEGRDTHTHTLTKGQASLFVYLATAGTLISHAGSHM